MDLDLEENGDSNRRQEYMPKCQKHVRKRFPILSWLPKYKRSDLVSDMIAGLTVGMTVVPQSMAYAAIAGLSPEFGLYSAYIGCFLYVILGSCRQVTIGPTAVMGLLTYETCSNDFPSCAILTGFYAGIFELMMAILQLGWVVSFISESVVIGFTSGAATTIISSQIKSFIGLKGPKGSGFVGYWSRIIRDFHTINLADCCMGVASFLFLLLLRKLKDYKHSKSPHKKRIEKACWLVSVSRNVIVVLLTSFLAFIWDTPPFTLTGHVPGGFPSIKVPQFNLPSTNNHTNQDYTTQMTFWETWSFIGTGPVIVALVAILQNVAISKAFGSGQTVDATQEMFALGISNILGSFFSSIPISGSFSRSAVNESSGVKSPMGGLFTGLLVLLSLGFLTKSFYFIPKSSLAAVIICAVMFMIEFESLPIMWKVNKLDAVTCIVTYMCCIFVGLEYGIMAGVVTSILFVLIKMLKPDISAKLVSDETSSIKFVHAELSPGIHFPSVDYIRNCLTKLSRRHSETNVIVLNLEKWETIDYTAVLALTSLYNSFRKEGKVLIFSSLNNEIQRVINATGFKEESAFCSGKDLTHCLRKVAEDGSLLTQTNTADIPILMEITNTKPKEDNRAENNTVGSSTSAHNEVSKPLLR